MSVKLKDVAARLNLSPSLVSGVLNNRTGVWASEETRQRIRTVVEEMGYRPNATARALRSGKTDTVGLFYLNRKGAQGETYFLPPGYEGVTEALAEYLGLRGLRLSINVFSEQQALLASLEETCRDRQCDAVVLWGQEADVEEQGIIPERYGVPFVAKGRLERSCPHWPQIDFDHEGMVHLCVERLCSLGHQKIAYLGYFHNEVFAVRLEEGFYNAIRQTLRTESLPDEYVICADSSVEAARITMERWLELPLALRPTAAVIGGSYAAWNGFELALAKRGRRVGYGPDDFAVMGVERSRLRLLFGEGEVFQNIELADLILAMGDCLLMPLLAGISPESPIVRILPKLGPIESWNLLDVTRFALETAQA